VGSTPACQSLAISNTGSAGSTLTWSATVQTGASWLTLPGTYSGTNSGTVSVPVHTAAVAAGNYTGSIRISAAGASNTPVNVPVTLTVSSPPSGSAILYFSLEIDHVAFTCNASSSDCAQSGNEFLTSSLNPFDNGKSASLVWNGSSFSLDTTYTVSGAPGYPYRVVLTGSVSSDGMTLGTTRITWTYTYGSHDSDITDVTIDQIPLTTSSNGRSTGGWVSTAAFQANPGKYVKNATWTHTYSSGASPVVSQIDLARTAAAQQGSYPITVYLGPF